MKNFTIKELEQLAGIKAHTLRIWEQRYGLFSPERVKGNFRRYKFADLKLLLDVTLLLKEGNKISHLADATPAALAEKIDSLTIMASLQHKNINELIVCMLSAEIEEFEDLLDSCVHTWGIDETITKIIIPFLERAELLSYREKTIEVHLVVTSVRKKIILGIEKANPSTLQQKIAVLFLAEGEHYDLVLLYLAYRLKCCGLRLIYLGTNISLANLVAIAAAKKPDLLVTYIPHKQKFVLNKFLPYLSEHAPQATLYVTTCGELQLEEQGNVKFVSYKELHEHV